MKNGLELLKIRALNETIDVSKFEEDNNLLLPHIYKVFQQTYCLGKDKTFFHEKYLNPSSDRLNGFMIQKFDSFFTSKAIMLNSLYSIEETMEIMKMIFPKEDDVWQQDLLLIGENDLNESFFVGINNENSDEIFWERTDLTPRFIKIANNIFEFIRGISVVPNEPYLGKYKLSQLNKNWYEDFWRVREENYTLPL